MKRPPTSSNSGPSTSRPYVKILRPWHWYKTTCRLCKTRQVTCHWITQDENITLASMDKFGGAGTEPNCTAACEECLRGMGLLW